MIMPPCPLIPRARVALAQVPSDPDQLKCGGVIEAARVTAGAAGESIREMMGTMSLDLLSRMVVNEKRIIEAGPITILSQM